MNLQLKIKAKTWLFGSKSNPNALPHEAIQYTDGTTSCNCPGWTRKIQPDGSRSCRHTRLVETGEADNYCVSKIEHNQVNKIKTKAPKPKPEPIIETPTTTGKIARRIQW